MNALPIVLAMLMPAVSPGDAPTKALPMAENSQWVDGTVLLLQDSNAVVSAVTDSRITHVAMLLRDSKSPMVYEATPGKVRRVSLPVYLREISELNQRRRTPMKVYALVPRRQYSERDVYQMRLTAGKGIGKRYSVKGYVRDKPSDGVHCSEYSSNVLSATSRHQFRSTHTITPVRLANLLAFSHRKPVRVALPAVANANWCERTSGCWEDFWGWCGWACVESLRFGF